MSLVRYLMYQKAREHKLSFPVENLCGRPGLQTVRGGVPSTSNESPTPTDDVSLPFISLVLGDQETGTRKEQTDPGIKKIYIGRGLSYKL